MTVFVDVGVPDGVRVAESVSKLLAVAVTATVAVGAADRDGALPELDGLTVASVVADNVGAASTVCIASDVTDVDDDAEAVIIDAVAESDAMEFVADVDGDELALSTADAEGEAETLRCAVFVRDVVHAAEGEFVTDDVRQRDGDPLGEEDGDRESCELRVLLTVPVTVTLIDVTAEEVDERLGGGELEDVAKAESERVVDVVTLTVGESVTVFEAVVDGDGVCVLVDDEVAEARDVAVELVEREGDAVGLKLIDGDGEIEQDDEEETEADPDPEPDTDTVELSVDERQSDAVVVADTVPEAVRLFDRVDESDGLVEFVLVAVVDIVLTTVKLGLLEKVTEVDPDMLGDGLEDGLPLSDTESVGIGKIVIVKDGCEDSDGEAE